MWYARSHLVREPEVSEQNISTISRVEVYDKQGTNKQHGRYIVSTLKTQLDDLRWKSAGGET